MDSLHLRAQSTFLEGAATVNVFYFEHLSQLTQALSQRLGRVLDLPRVNGPASQLKKPSPRKERKLRERVAEIYAEDYRRFYPDHEPPAPDPWTSGLIRSLRSALPPRLGRR